MSYFSSLPAFTSDWPEHKLLDYAVNHLEWMEQNCNSDEERCALRRIAVEVAHRFGEPGSVFFDHPKMLTVVRIIGKVSRRMGLKGVLEKAYERGQFRKLAEFYIMWAKLYAEEGNEICFNEVWALALMASAQPLSRIDQVFSSMRREYFSTAIGHSTLSVSGNAEGKQENIGRSTAKLNVFPSTAGDNTQHCYSSTGVPLGKQQQKQKVLYATSGEVSSSQLERNFARHSPKGKENRNGREDKMAIFDESLSMEERATALIGCAISPYALKNRESTILLEKTMDLVNSLKSDTISSHSYQTVSENTAISLSSPTLANQKQATTFGDRVNADVSTDYKAPEVQSIGGEDLVLHKVVDSSITIDEQIIKRNEQMVSERIPQFCGDLANVNPIECQAHSDHERIVVKEEKASDASTTPRELKPPPSFFALPGYSVFKQAPPMKSFPEMPDLFRKKQANYSACTSESTPATTSASTGGSCSVIISPTSDWGGFRPASANCADALFPVPKGEFAGMTGFERRMSLSKKKVSKVMQNCTKEQTLLGCTLKISNEVAQAFSQLNIGKSGETCDSKLNKQINTKTN